MNERVKWVCDEVFLREVFRYSMWILLPLFFIACHQALTNKNYNSSSKSADSTARMFKRIGKTFPIDTLEVPIGNRTELVPSTEEYFKKKVAAKIELFYSNNKLHTKWLGDKGPTKLYHELGPVFKNSERHGMNPSDYDLEKIQLSLIELYENNPGKEEIAEMDIRISQIFFLFTTHLNEGRIVRTGFGKNIWKRIPKDFSTEDVSMLLGTRKATHLLKEVEKLKPGSDAYVKLEKAYKQYRLLDPNLSGIFQTIKIDRKIKPGKKHESISMIRATIGLHDSKKYEAQIDTTTGLLDSLLYDATLLAGIKSFQQRHGLEADGIIGGKTVKFLNQSFEEKAKIIALNMERLRWAPSSYGERYIIVNIPDYNLRVFENGKQDFEMRVIVGAPEKATPIFQDVLEHIVFAPTWTVPTSIIREEIIPKLQENPEHYAEGGYTFYKNNAEIDPLDESWGENINPKEYRIVQRSGEGNALGLVKFVLPNRYNIYLHDTPGQRLFKNAYRAYSHGCVRVNEPERFAEYLLKDKKWETKNISEAMHGEDPTTVHLKNHYPIYFQYQTAWVDNNGVVQFREDIYDHDKHQLKQLYSKASAIAKALNLSGQGGQINRTAQ